MRRWRPTYRCEFVACTSPHRPRTPGKRRAPTDKFRSRVAHFRAASGFLSDRRLAYRTHVLSTGRNDRRVAAAEQATIASVLSGHALTPRDGGEHCCLGCARGRDRSGSAAPGHCNPPSPSPPALALASTPPPCGHLEATRGEPQRPCGHQWQPMSALRRSSAKLRRPCGDLAATHGDLAATRGDLAATLGDLATTGGDLGDLAATWRPHAATLQRPSDDPHRPFGDPLRPCGDIAATRRRALAATRGDPRRPERQAAGQTVARAGGRRASGSSPRAQAWQTDDGRAAGLPAMFLPTSTAGFRPSCCLQICSVWPASLCERRSGCCWPA